MFLSRVVAFSRLVRSIVRTPGIGGLRENLRSLGSRLAEPSSPQPERQAAYQRDPGTRGGLYGGWVQYVPCCGAGV